MAERKTYTAEDFKGCHGRRVLVEGVITNPIPDPEGDIGVLFPYVAGGRPGANDVPISPSAVVEMLPEEIGVGDKVAGLAGAFAKVLALHEGRAWVLYGDGRRDDWPLSDLTLVERAG